MYKNKKLLITGGTGSFGRTVVDRFEKSDFSEIRILSRDEKKQNDMRKYYQNKKLKFYIGDVRDKNSLMSATKNVDYIFHAAALKQVPSCEFFPSEAIKTNILGTENLLDAAIENKVSRIVCLSTDKAVYPINAMGISKAMMEKIMIAKSRNLKDTETVISCTRYGNVMASRGSVIPLFVEQIINNEPITLTDPNMTRFMMSLDESVDLVLYAFNNSKNGDIFVQKAPASSLDTLVKALLELFDKKEHPVKIIGTRHGEKLYETLLSREEIAGAKEKGNYYQVSPDKRDLSYNKYVEVGEQIISEKDDYTSHNTYQLTINETKDLLLKLEFIQNALIGNYSRPLD